MTITSTTAPLVAFLWLAAPLVLSIAFFLWWRRLRHWSFMILSVATGMSVVGQLCSFLATNIPRFGKTPEQVADVHDILALLQANTVLQLVMGILLLVGAFGLVFAARSDFLLDDAKKSRRRRSADPSGATHQT